MNQISLEPLNGFMPNSQRSRAWSLARTSLNVNVKGQGHQEQKMFCACTPVTPATVTEWNMLAANNVMQQQRDHSVAVGSDFGSLCAVDV